MSASPAWLSVRTGAAGRDMLVEYAWLTGLAWSVHSSRVTAMMPATGTAPQQRGRRRRLLSPWAPRLRREQPSPSTTRSPLEPPSLLTRRDTVAHQGDGLVAATKSCLIVAIDAYGGSHGFQYGSQHWPIPPPVARCWPRGRDGNFLAVLHRPCARTPVRPSRGPVRPSPGHSSAHARRS